MPVCPKCHEKNPKLGAKCPRDGFFFIEEGALDEADEDPRIGTMIADKFVIVDLISEGGMGAVYKAIQLPVEREVAVKVLRAELEDSDQGRDRFIREARAVSKLTHPNVITLHDFGFEDSGHPYMVMEYAPGVSLNGWLRQSDLTVGRIIHVLQQVLSALSDAHKRGIVHRDLKPENLIVTKTGNDEDFIKLLDFGIARLVNEGSTKGLTREGEVFGTPHYMSPEQAKGSTDIGPPADVYAMGIIGFELFSGAPPFDASTPLSVLYMHINDELPTLRPRAGLSPPDAVHQLIRTATHKDPQERYQTAAEMLSELNRLLEGDGTAERPPSYSAGASQSGQFPSSGSQAGPGPATDRGSQNQTRRITDDLSESAPPEPTDAETSVAQAQVTARPPTPTPEDKPGDEPTLVGQENNKRNLLVAAAMFAIVVGVSGAVAMFVVSDDGEPRGDEGTGAAESAPDQPVEDEASPTVAKSEQESTSAPESATGADGDESEPGERSENTEASADREADDEETTPEETADARQKPHENAGERTDDSAPEKTGQTDPAPSREQPEPSRTASSEESPAQSDDEDEEEPEKFEPSKFRPAEKSDDEPKKFEPKKWK